MSEAKEEKIYIGRAWCFTEYEMKSDALLKLETTLQLWRVAFISFQHEICPETQRKHIQGFITFRSARRLSGLKLLLPGAHWEPARDKSPYKKAIQYTTIEKLKQDGTPDTSWVPDTQFQWGIAPKTGGGRTDIETLRETAQSGVSFQECLETQAAAWRYPRATKEYIAAYRRPEPFVIPARRQAECIWGNADLGKTYGVMQEAQGEAKSLCIIEGDQIKKDWYDGYENHEWVLFDDCDGATWRTPKNFYNAVDRPSGRVPIKGGFAPWDPKRIIITSDKHPYDWWPHYFHAKPNNQAQLKRRFKHIWHMEDDGNFTDSKNYEPEPPLLAWCPGGGGPVLPPTSVSN